MHGLMVSAFRAECGFRPGQINLFPRSVLLPVAAKCLDVGVQKSRHPTIKCLKTQKPPMNEHVLNLVTRIVKAHESPSRELRV